MIGVAAPFCQLCGKRAATYVCRTCGRTVCSECFDPARWSCSDCLAKASPPAAEHPAISQFSTAIWLFFIAFAMIFIGMLLMTIGSLTSPGGVSGGAVILIGPIPIILGAGPYSLAMIALAAVLTVSALAVFLVLRRKAQR